MNILVKIICFLLICSTIFSQSSDEEVVISISGSDTMLSLTEILSEEFSEIHPNISFRIYGGGTSIGIKYLLENKIDICMASRDLTPSESKKLAEYYNSIGMYYLIAKDAVCVYINKENSSKDFSQEELFEIFSGKVENWKYFDGLNRPIKPVIRPETSGTRRFFNQSILKGNKFSKNSIILETTEEIVEEVYDNPFAIGFGGLGHAKNINLASVDGISPTYNNIKTDKYPLTRYLHFFTSNTASGSVKKFIDWVLSPEGQKIVKERGFVPLWEINY